MDRATPSCPIAHRTGHKTGRWLWSAGDGHRRRLLTALGHVIHRLQVLSTQTDDCRLLDVHGECTASTVVYRRWCGQISSTVNELCWQHLTTVGVLWRNFSESRVAWQKLITWALPRPLLRRFVICKGLWNLLLLWSTSVLYLKFLSLAVTKSDAKCIQNG